MLNSFYLSHGYLILLVFLISLLLTHVFAYANRHRLTKRIWKCGDYLWLGLAAVSLSITIANLRVTVAEPEIQHLKDAISESYSDWPVNFATDDWVYDNALRLLGREIEFTKNYPKSTDKDLQAILQTIDKLQLTDNVKQALREAYFFWDVKRNGLQSGIDRLMLRNKLRDDLEKVESDARRTNTEVLLLLFGPFALALAAGIRITMTTVEVLCWYKE